MAIISPKSEGAFSLLAVGVLGAMGGGLLGKWVQETILVCWTMCQTRVSLPLPIAESGDYVTQALGSRVW